MLKSLFTIFLVGIVATVGAVATVNLAGCSSTNSNVVNGQLFCATATATGPLVVALADEAGVPFTVTNKASALVSAACALVNGIPVTPPANPTQAPVVAAKTSSLTS